MVFLQLIRNYDLTTVCPTGLIIFLWVPAGGSITSRYIFLWHQINGGLWRILYWPTFIIIGAQGFWTWGLSLLLNWGAHTMGAPIFTLVAFWWHWQLFIQYDSSPLHQPVLLVFGTIWGRSTYDLGGLSPGVDISVAGCHRLTFGAFYSHTGCWVGSGGSFLAWASCPAYFCPLEGLVYCCRGPGDCLVGFLNLLLPTTRDYLFHTSILWNN